MITLKGYWICTNGKEHRPDTISSSKKDAISKLIEGTVYTWNEAKMFGWLVKRVNIQILD